MEKNSQPRVTFLTRRMMVEKDKNLESVETYLARGGQVTRLPAPWAGGAKMAEDRVKGTENTWGSWGRRN